MKSSQMLKPHSQPAKPPVHKSSDFLVESVKSPTPDTKSFHHTLKIGNKSPKLANPLSLHCISERNIKQWMLKQKDKLALYAIREVIAGEFFRFFMRRHPKVRWLVLPDQSNNVIIEYISGFCDLYEAKKEIKTDEDIDKFFERLFAARGDLAEILVLALFLGEFDLKSSNLGFTPDGRIIKVDNELCFAQRFIHFGQAKYKHTYNHQDLINLTQLVHYTPDNWLWSITHAKKSPSRLNEKLKTLHSDPVFRMRAYQMQLRLILLPDSFFDEMITSYSSDSNETAALSDFFKKSRMMMRASSMDCDFQVYLQSNEANVFVEEFILQCNSFTTMSKYKLCQNIPRFNENVIDLWKQVHDAALEIQLVQTLDKKDFSSAQKILEIKPRLNLTGIRTTDDSLPVHLSAYSPSIDIIKSLCEEHKVCLTKENKYNDTALSIAARNSPAVLMYLIESKECIQVFRTSQICQAMYYLCKNNNYDAIDSLLKKRPDVKDYNSKGRSLLHDMTIKKWEVKTVQVVCRLLGIEFGVLSQENVTELYYATQNKDFSLIKFFLESAPHKYNVREIIYALNCLADEKIENSNLHFISSIHFCVQNTLQSKQKIATDFVKLILKKCESANAACKVIKHLEILEKQNALLQRRVSPSNPTMNQWKGREVSNCWVLLIKYTKQLVLSLVKKSDLFFDDEVLAFLVSHTRKWDSFFCCVSSEARQYLEMFDTPQQDSVEVMVIHKRQ